MYLSMTFYPDVCCCCNLMFYDWHECDVYLAPQNTPSTVVLTLGNKVVFTAVGIKTPIPTVYIYSSLLTENVKEIFLITDNTTANSEQNLTVCFSSAFYFKAMLVARRTFLKKDKLSVSIFFHCD